MSDLTTNREVTDNSRLVNRWLNRTTWGRAAGCLSILTLLLAACTANTPALVQQAEETTAETVVELVAQETVPPPPTQAPATATPMDQQVFEFDDPALPGLLGPQYLLGKRYTLDYESGLMAISERPLPS